MMCMPVRTTAWFLGSLLLLVLGAAGCHGLPPVFPSSDPTAAETARLRALAAAGDDGALSQALDASVVAIPAGEFIMGSDAGRDDEPVTTTSTWPQV